MRLLQRIKGPFAEYRWDEGPNTNSPQWRGFERGGAWYPPAASVRMAKLRDLAGNRVAIFKSSTEPSWTNNAEMGSVLSFDGNDYVTLPSLFPSSTGTLSIWVRPNATLINHANFIVQNSNGDGYNAGLFFYSGIGPRLRIYNIAAYDAAQSASVLGGIWYHFVGMWGPLGMCLYSNGNQVATNAYTGIMTSNVQMPTIGTFSYSGGYLQYLTGSVGDIRIRSVALSPAEVWAEWDPATRWDLYPDALVRWWPGVTDAALYHSIFGVGPSPLESVIIGRLPHGQA